MTTDTQIVDLIEQATDARPFCPCGWHTTPVWRDGTVWLECGSLSQRGEGIVHRLIGLATAPAHVRIPIVDVPAARVAA